MPTCLLLLQRETLLTVVRACAALFFLLAVVFGNQWPPILHAFTRKSDFDLSDRMGQFWTNMAAVGSCVEPAIAAACPRCRVLSYLTAALLGCDSQAQFADDAVRVAAVQQHHAAQHELVVAAHDQGQPVGAEVWLLGQLGEDAEPVRVGGSLGPPNN